MKLLPLSLLTFMLAAPQALALSSDTEQPIYIDSDSQNLDMKSNQVTFSGDVKLKQGSINISADKIVVTRNSTDGSIKQVQSMGKPATFSQLTDDGKTLEGEGNELDYRMAEDSLHMKGSAMLSQDGNVIRGSSITYQITSQKLIANSTENQRVTTVLQPTQATNK
ncbi:lipopolysaccharide transport periplasmic protein LptA [Vibrio sp. 10N.286.49.B3]|uniref:lipopolysaccharide transport periplasmic protein LptA n=1 Tax=Vibrio sp. 10N.286.49.B3 TaxID=1880855 RepID=UPI000C841F17|nr:lipopolysaccharide transport periplasmic protein LptA [Vibrio sp. 10N.286.49.B3]PMH42535.1 lipopolysaccharide transport periplasmic protein LptA [Vibrio sp. 10N.286.49.B3]